MELILGLSISGIIGFILAIPAILTEISRRTKNLPLLLDVHFFRGRKLTDGEAFALSLLFHLVTSILFGALYVYLVQSGLFAAVQFADYSLLSILIFGVVFWLLIGLIGTPILGIGIFGKKESPHIWHELLFGHLLLAFGVWLVIQAYQPIFFV